MKLRAFADELYTFRPAAPKDSRIKINRLRKTGLKEIARTVADYDWDRTFRQMEKSLDIFCTGVILLAILYFTPVIISLF